MRAARFLGLAAALAGPAAADTPPESTAELERKVDALQADVTQLRAQLARILALEEAPLALLRTQLGAPVDAKPAAPIQAPPPPPCPPGFEGPPCREKIVARVEEKKPAARPGPGEIFGRVTLQPGVGPDAWVFVADVSEAPVTRGAIEISQVNMQFSPQFAVVQKGTLIRFPNRDKLAHNVFSLTPGNSFDLGKYTADEPARDYRVLTPGPLNIFCDIHSDMNATVYVLPNHHYVKVAADGTYHLKGVPPGTHTLSAWAPRGLTTRNGVEVTSDHAVEISFNLERAKEPYNPRHPPSYER